MKRAAKMIYLGRWAVGIFIASAALAAVQELGLYINRTLAGYDEMSLMHHLFYGIAASFSSGVVFTFTGSWAIGSGERLAAAKIFAVAFACMAFYRMVEAALLGDDQGVPAIFVAAAACAGMFGAFGTWYVLNTNGSRSPELQEGS